MGSSSFGTLRKLNVRINLLRPDGSREAALHHPVTLKRRSELQGKTFRRVKKKKENRNLAATVSS